MSVHSHFENVQQKLGHLGQSLMATATSMGHAAHAASTRKHYSSQELMQMESDYSAHNYHPLPVVLDRALGARVWDPEGKEYLDFLSAYSAVNQGHCHPVVVGTLVAQAQKLTLSSRAFYNSVFAQFAKRVNEIFKYDMVLPMNTGAEAVETAMKLARKWAYEKKGVPEDKARILSATGNFHGRTIGVISMSTDPDSRNGFGPMLDRVGPRVGDVTIRYNHIEDIKAALEKYGNETAAVLLEPIQGEAGIIVPDDNYFPQVAELCKKHNVLLICDEIQTGLGRTGRMLCCEHYGIRPDIVTLGKALSAGVYPVSAVLADKDVMLCIKAGEHGSTYGGNPLGSAVAITALDVLINEKLCERAEKLGESFRTQLKNIKSPLLTTVRGKGLLNAIVIDETKSTKGRTAWDLCLLLKEKGLLAKPTHQNIIRLAPPLVISEDEMKRGINIIEEALNELDKVDTIPGAEAH
ncbi:ornithine aminotransferase [Malassezia pachydermatis]|uniref:Ornithine aminotransferase n=1 Tax=Malassezia pachydermatis TaxID=77020 RepID=A0A0M8MNF9_9BASI|nr:ornithine aminotransferase [Malassezia pachydermatis]KOS15098.1 ornithine aminotransferase [Malassezia pachydermatis]